jgi:adenosylmethionine-8-amino-7-oxononanoate aminotransferase
MKLIGRLGIPSSLEKITGSFNAGLERFREYEVVGDIRSIGLIGALEFVKNRNTRESFPPQQRFARAIALKALELGLIIRPLGDVVYFMPPFTISDEQMENMFFLMHRAIKETIHEQPPA